MQAHYAAGMHRGRSAAPGRSARLGIAAAALLSIGVAAAAESDGYRAFLGLWETENGRSRVELREESGGSFSVLLVWAADDASPKTAARVGSVMVRNLSWEERSGSFVGGTAIVERGGRTIEIACRLVPKGAGELEMRGSTGLLRRRAVWRRPS